MNSSMLLPSVTGSSSHTSERRQILVKICGITCYDDARFALDAGANALGFIFAESSRRITVDTARDIIARLPKQGIYVGVFMNQSLEFIRGVLQGVSLTHLQLHGHENPTDFASCELPIIKRIKVNDHDVQADLADRVNTLRGALPLVDPGCGGGESFDWLLLAGAHRSYLLAGGLTPDNVNNAISMARPMGVDVCSGVERIPGVKDRSLLHAFISNIRSSHACH